MSRRRRVLVTGGAGFVGSHLVERLCARGDDVLVLDDLSTGRAENLAGAPCAELVRGTVEDEKLVAALVESCDAVFHLAAAVGMRVVLADPLRTLATNVHGTEVVASACARRDVPLLLVSSSEVYGRGVRMPVSEDDDLLLGSHAGPRWTYAASKLAGEHYAMARRRADGLPVRIVRLFNTSGPRQVGEHGMVLPRLAAQAVRGGPVTVHGDGTQTRTFCHVADAVEALLRLADTPAAEGGVFNVGGSEEVTIADLARRVVAAAGTDAAIAHVPHADVYGPAFEDLTRRVPDVTRLAATTGFAPKIPLDRIVRDVVDWARA